MEPKAELVNSSYVKTELNNCPPSQRRSGRKPGARVTNSARLLELSSQKWCKLLHVIRKLQNFQGYIFLILQYFATKLCNFTHFNTIFLAAAMDFVLLA